jgi:hypothetical protein
MADMAEFASENPWNSLESLLEFWKIWRAEVLFTAAVSGCCD